MSKHAKLRVCASCEWIFRDGIDCPKCGFDSYGARYVYGDVCYKYERTQQPWLDEKLCKYELKLLDEIKASNPKRQPIKLQLKRFCNG
jgi:hypothetical protein